jgi:hypothetical protein
VPESSARSSARFMIFSHTRFCRFPTSATENVADDPDAVISSVLARGMLPGIALKPSTAVDTVLPFVHRLSHGALRERHTR